VVSVEFRHDAAGQVRGAAITAPRALEVSADHEPRLIAGCLQIAVDDVLTEHHLPVEASMGNVFVVVEVTPDALSRAAPDAAAFRRAHGERPSRGRLAVLAYARNEDGVRCRMFSPLTGTPEDPATGSANMALAGLLLKLSDERRLAFTSVQGVETGRPSRLELEAWHTPDGILASVAGGCVPVLRGEAQLA
jgi:trans-2,3-dihydro-3-hydroxyanthranilate isomerase